MPIIIAIGILLLLGLAILFADSHETPEQRRRRMLRDIDTLALYASYEMLTEGRSPDEIFNDLFEW
ncbi:MAG: hypothetical protein Kow0047_12540 [Anaerolineae bacterium]